MGGVKQSNDFPNKRHSMHQILAISKQHQDLLLHHKTQKQAPKRAHSFQVNNMIPKSLSIFNFHVFNIWKIKRRTETKRQKWQKHDSSARSLIKS